MQEYRVKVYANGDKSWYQNGKLHREDGPAVEHANGDKSWYQNGKLHREDGPAIEDADGYKAWYQNDTCHREDGPAVEYANGDKEWYIDGKKLFEEEFNDRNKVEVTLKDIAKSMNIDIDKAASDEVNGRMKRLVSFIFGEPIWIEYHNGKIRKRRMRRLFNGRVVFRGFNEEVVGNADGSMVNDHYVVRWYPRDSIIG